MPGASSESRRVLVVDDEPTIAASVAARLRAEGCGTAGAVVRRSGGDRVQHQPMM